MLWQRLLHSGMSCFIVLQCKAKYALVFVYCSGTQGSPEWLRFQKFLLRLCNDAFWESYGPLCCEITTKAAVFTGELGPAAPQIERVFSVATRVLFSFCLETILLALLSIIFAGGCQDQSQTGG